MEEPKEEEERDKLRGSEGREFGRRSGWEIRGAVAAEADSGTAVKLPARVAGRRSVCIAAGDEERGESPFAFYGIFLFLSFAFLYSIIIPGFQIRNITGRSFLLGFSVGPFPLSHWALPLDHRSRCWHKLGCFFLHPILFHVTTYFWIMSFKK